MPDYTYAEPRHIFPTNIQTERLEFRRATPDVLPVRELYKKYKSLTSHSTQYVTFNPHTTPHETLDWLLEKPDAFENGESAGYFIFPKEADEYTVDNLIGVTGIEPDWEKNKAESGIFLFKEHWGNGYSTERGKMMVHLAFTELDLKFFLSRCDPKNTQSKKAIEKYLFPYGGEQVGTLPTSHSLDSDQVLIYKLTRDAYKNNTN